MMMAMGTLPTARRLSTIPPTNMRRIPEFPSDRWNSVIPFMSLPQNQRELSEHGWLPTRNHRGGKYSQSQHARMRAMRCHSRSSSKSTHSVPPSSLLYFYHDAILTPQTRSPITIAYISIYIYIYPTSYSSLFFNKGKIKRIYFHLLLLTHTHTHITQNKHEKKKSKQKKEKRILRKHIIRNTHTHTKSTHAC